jgi:iron complex outermembrane receptor protein
VLSAGLRFDYHHLIKALPINPRIGLIWHPLDSTTYKLLYSSTFRAPNISDLDYNPYYFDLTTPLQEELIKSYEAIVEWRPAAGIKLMGSIFNNDISRLLAVDPNDPDSLLANRGKYQSYGVEWEAEKRWQNGRLLTASYTYSHVTNQTSPNAQTLGSPEQLFKLHYAEPLFGNFAKVGIENIFVSDRKTLNGSLADAYDLINVNLTSDKLIKGVDVSMAVYNLLDNHYQVLGNEFNNTLSMNGREFRLKLLLSY